VRYALVAYGASWIVVGGISLVARLLFGVHGWSGVGALWFDVAWLVSLVPLYHAGVLSAGALGLRRAPAMRSVGFALLVFVSASVFDALWRSALSLAPVSNPFSGVSGNDAAMIVLAGVAAVASPVIEEVFFRGFLFRCFRDRFALLPASAIIGVMFGLVHTEYPLGVLPELAVYGALLCVLYEYTGSLWPGIALNMYFDAGGFEQALTGRSTVVLWSFALLVLALLVRSRPWTTGAPSR
jgi:membrane protease YdiL (CAAX protease family)